MLYSQRGRDIFFGLSKEIFNLRKLPIKMNIVNLSLRFPETAASSPSPDLAGVATA
jgi:hypothetical protein